MAVQMTTDLGAKCWGTSRHTILIPWLTHHTRGHNQALLKVRETVWK